MITAFPRSSRFRKAAVVSVVAAAALVLAGCSTPEATPTDDAGAGALRIGFSPFTLQVPALQGLADGLTHAAEEAGDTVVVADPKADPSTQLQQIQQWVQLDQVDAIWVIPVAGEVIADALVEAQAKGIVVLASGLPSDYGFDGPQAGITFSNVDNANYGDQLGQLAADCIAEKFGGEGKIIYLQSPSGQQSSQDLNGRTQAVVEEAGSTIVNTQDAADRLGSAQIVLSALQGAPDANTVIGTDDEATLGALDALEQAGKSAADFCVVGAGGNDEALAAVTAGDIYGEVAFDFFADLTQNLTELHRLAEDPTQEGQQITTPIKVVTE